MTREQIERLASRYLAGEATPDEIQHLHEWFEVTDEGETEIVLMNNVPDANQFYDDMLSAINRDINVLEQARRAPLIRIIGRWYLAAAVMLLPGLTGGYLLFVRQSKQQVAPRSIPVVRTDVPPGGNKAVLTLADGSNVKLDSTANGKIASQGSVKVLKQTNGQLAYIGNSTRFSRSVQYRDHPEGGQYKLILQDGTTVWLNAASSIRYPTSFSGSERIVQITGEAYFEVAHHPGMPFHVSVNGLDVRDLGTRFNINAYADESCIKTTLVEGSVSVGGIRLLPGQQAQAADHRIQVVKADVEEALAWKNGFFQFNHTGVAAVMRQLSRWYDVDVSYEGTIPPREFGGAIERGLSLSQVLNLLQKSQTHFRIEGRKLIVMP